MSRMQSAALGVAVLLIPAAVIAATFVVNDTTIGPLEANPGDGICENTIGTCTFHAAHAEAEAFPGADVIIVPAGEWNPHRQVSDDLHIIGVGSGSAAGTIFNGGAAESEFFVGAVFGVDPGVHLQLTSVRLENGNGGVQVNGRLTVEDTVFADHLGRAGIWCGGAPADSVSVSGSTFERGDSAAITCGAPVTITDSVFVDNRNSNTGGAISTSGPLTIVGSRFESNSVNNSGGAIRTMGETLIDRTTFVRNRAGNTGGAISAGDGLLTVRDSTFHQNHAGNVGGGIAADMAVHITNSTFNNDRAGNTASALSIDGAVTLNNVTVWSSFRTLIDIDGSLTVSNSILQGDVSVCSGEIESAGHNIFTGPLDRCTIVGDTSTDQFGVDPMLGVLKDNGGPTWTRRLLEGSPAIDAAGDDCEASDQRGYPRPLGAGCDIGAYEKLPCDLDGVVEAGEVCDDGNLVDGDGCSSLCQTELLSGKRLKLTTKAGDPSKSKLVFQSKDTAIRLGYGNGTSDDPVLHGGSVRVVSEAGDGFDDVYDLPASGWSYIGQPGQNRGYRYKDPDGLIRRVLVKNGKQIKILGKGTLGHSLSADPNPVAVSLTIGTRLHQSVFGGSVRFKQDRAYRAKLAPRASAMIP